MKLSPLQQHNNKSPSNLFWLIFHAFCCLISLISGFRFSRLVFFLLFSTSTNLYTVTPPLKTTISNLETTQFPPTTSSLSIDDETTLNRSSSSRVVVGRHGILIRPWPHPNSIEVMKAHRIIQTVQRQQKRQYSIKNPKKTLIVITPTYVRTFQTLHLTSLMQSLMLVPYDLIWIVVEAGGNSTETASLLEKSGLRTIHIGFDERMPVAWKDRHRMEARMRFRALRVVRDQRLDGIVMFGDDSNVHSLDLFDEIQAMKWFGAVSVGFLAHGGNLEQAPPLSGKKDLPKSVQGPVCNSSGQLAGWHRFNSLLYKEKSGDRAIVLQRKFEWAGFVLNSRLVWKGAEDKPEWVRDMDTVIENGKGLESPLSLLKNASFVEPLGDCGRKVLLWWLRVEARADSKFPPGWILDRPLQITVPVKRIPLQDAPSELPSDGNVNGYQETEKRPTKMDGSWNKRSMNDKL